MQGIVPVRELRLDLVLASSRLLYHISSFSSVADCCMVDILSLKPSSFKLERARARAEVNLLTFSSTLLSFVSQLFEIPWEEAE